MKELQLPNGETVRIGDYIRITARPFEGPAIGTICQVTAIATDSIRIADPSRNSGWYGKMPKNIELHDNPLSLDVGL